MKTIYLDIETIPTQKPGAMEAIKSNLQPPGNISKSETIAAWWKEKAPAAVDEQYRKTALNGTEGEIVCIGWALDNGDTFSVSRGLDGSEASILAEFFGHMDAATQSQPLWVGHNIISFDLRYLFQRAVITGVNPLQPLPHDTRYNGEKVYDTMLAWAGWGNRISLVNLCAALAIPVKQGDITGATVWDAIQAGRIADVADYCREDVAATREAYHRMTFGQRR